MKKQIYKAAILTVGVTILIAGCGGQDALKSEAKRKRLIVAEVNTKNKQLKKRVSQLENELEKQKELLAKQLPEKKTAEENAKLRQTNEKLEDELKQLKDKLAKMKGEKKYRALENELAEISMRYLGETAELRKENEKLEDEIIELKKELETYKSPTSLPHKD